MIDSDNVNISPQDISKWVIVGEHIFKEKYRMAQNFDSGKL